MFDKWCSFFLYLWNYLVMLFNFPLNVLWCSESGKGASVWTGFAEPKSRISELLRGWNQNVWLESVVIKLLKGKSLKPQCIMHETRNYKWPKTGFEEPMTTFPDWWCFSSTHQNLSYCDDMLDKTSIYINSDSVLGGPHTPINTGGIISKYVSAKSLSNISPDSS